MAASVVYSSIFGAVMASLPAVSTRLVVFDTSVVDMTEKLGPSCGPSRFTRGQHIIARWGTASRSSRDHRETILILISDLYEGGVEKNLLQRANELVQGGVEFITLLALDEGAPAFDARLVWQPG